MAISGHTTMHDTETDSYMFNSLEIAVGPDGENVTLTAGNGDGAFGQPLYSDHPEVIAFVQQVIASLHRNHYRSHAIRRSKAA